jgi:hypothetical protein
MNLTLSNEQKQIEETVRSLAWGRLAPKAAAIDPEGRCGSRPLGKATTVSG